MAVSEMNTLWIMDVQGYCSRKIEVIADNEEQAKERALEEFDRLWKLQPDQRFDLNEMDVWEWINATETRHCGGDNGR